jgi:hypothetical protein
MSRRKQAPSFLGSDAVRMPLASGSERRTLSVVDVRRIERVRHRMAMSRLVVGC